MKYTLAFLCTLLLSSIAMAEPIPSSVICHVSKKKFKCNSAWVKVGGARLGCFQRVKFLTVDGSELDIKLNADPSDTEQSIEEVRTSIKNKIEEFPKCSKTNTRIFAGERETKEINRQPGRSPESSSVIEY